MTLILDAGAFIALERHEPALMRRLKSELHAGTTPRTNGGVVAQVWRGGRGRQARLASALAAVDVVAIDDALGRRAGHLLGVARRADPIDAAVVAMADDGDLIVTSDRVDIERLIAVSGRDIATLPI